MSWMLVGQIALLLVLLMLCVIMTHGAIVDKRREDDFKRRSWGS